MSDFVPSMSTQLPPDIFNQLIASDGVRIMWMRSHSCPCVFSQTTIRGRLSTPGSAQASCKTCLGLGTYWDPPSLPFQALVTFRHLSPSPDEPGTIMNEQVGVIQMSEPTLTIPNFNPSLDISDPAQPTIAWTNASTDDMFVAVDMVARYTVKLQVGGIQNLPFQQNVQLAPAGAVTVWDPDTFQVQQVASYSVNGPTVTIDGYPDGTAYMVEFQAAPIYVAFRRAGGLPHIRPFGDTMTLPRTFRLQALDLWTRQRGIQTPTPTQVTTGGSVSPFVVAVASMVMAV